MDKKTCYSKVTRGPYQQKRWTDEEKRYLRQHRYDGSELVAEALGKSVCAVKQMAHRLHISLRVQPGDTCPLCGTYVIQARTDAAHHGMCPLCWERRKRKAMEERAALARERKLYDAAKHRAKYVEGVSADGRLGEGGGSDG